MRSSSALVCGTLLAPPKDNPQPRSKEKTWPSQTTTARDRQISQLHKLWKPVSLFWSCTLCVQGSASKVVETKSAVVLTQVPPSREGGGGGEAWWGAVGGCEGLVWSAMGWQGLLLSHAEACTGTYPLPFSPPSLKGAGHSRSPRPPSANNPPTHPPGGCNRGHHLPPAPLGCQWCCLVTRALPAGCTACLALEFSLG